MVQVMWWWWQWKWGLNMLQNAKNESGSWEFEHDKRLWIILFLFAGFNYAAFPQPDYNPKNIWNFIKMNEKIIFFKLLLHWILCQMLSDVACSSDNFFKAGKPICSLFSSEIKKLSLKNNFCGRFKFIHPTNELIWEFLICEE